MQAKVSRTERANHESFTRKFWNSSNIREKELELGSESCIPIARTSFPVQVTIPFSFSLKIIIDFFFFTNFSGTYVFSFFTWPMISVTILLYERCYLTCLASLVIKEVMRKLHPNIFIIFKPTVFGQNGAFGLYLYSLSMQAWVKGVKTKIFTGRENLQHFTSVHVNFLFIYLWLPLYTAIWGKEKSLLKTLCYVFSVSPSFMKLTHHP